MSRKELIRQSGGSDRSCAGERRVRNALSWKEGEKKAGEAAALGVGGGEGFRPCLPGRYGECRICSQYSGKQ